MYASWTLAVFIAILIEFKWFSFCHNIRFNNFFFFKIEIIWIFQLRTLLSKLFYFFLFTFKSLTRFQIYTKNRRWIYFLKLCLSFSIIEYLVRFAWSLSSSSWEFKWRLIGWTFDLISGSKKSSIASAHVIGRFVEFSSNVRSRVLQGQSGGSFIEPTLRALLRLRQWRFRKSLVSL